MHPILRRLIAACGFNPDHQIAGSKPAYVNRPPLPVIVPAAAPVLLVPGPVKGWNGCPPSNQRKARKNKRRAHAAGNRKAFA